MPVPSAHAPQGYGSRSVYLSVNSLTATYLVCESKVWCYTVPCDVPKVCIVWISPKTLCLSVLVSFADSKLLAFARTSALIA